MPLPVSASWHRSKCPSFLTVSCCLCQHPNIMDSAADILKQLPGDYHHVFDIVHFILCIQGDRADLGDG